MNYLRIFKMPFIILFCNCITYAAQAIYSKNEMEQIQKDSDVKAQMIGDESRVFMGLSGGVNSPRGEYNSRPAIGLNLGWQPTGHWGYMGELVTSQLDGAIKEYRTSILLLGAYKVSKDVPIFGFSYTALGAGTTIIASKSNLTFMPEIGIDLPLNDKIHEYFTLGINAKYMFIAHSPDSFVGGAAVKYWY